MDLSSARITLYQTKSEKPRGVPINRAVYEALIELEPDSGRRQGRLFPNGNDRRGSPVRASERGAPAPGGRATGGAHEPSRGGLGGT